MKMTARKRLIAILLSMCMAFSLLAGMSVLVGAEDVTLTSDSISDLAAVYSYVENDDVLGDLQVDASVKDVASEEYVMVYIYQNVNDISDPTNGKQNAPVTSKGFYASSIVSGALLSKELQLTPLKLNGKAVLGLQVAGRGEENDWVYSYITTALNIDANGGELIADSSVQVELGFSVLDKISAQDLVKREYYELAGWAETPDGAPITSDLLMSPYGDTVYALWTQLTAGVSFDANGGEGTMDAVSIPLGTATALPAATFTKEGHRFAGWATAPDGAVAYADAQQVTLTAEGDITLYAVWEYLPDFEVVFNANGGEGTMDKQIIENNVATALSLNQFTRKGYTFKGWATSPDGDVVYADGQEVTLNEAGLQLYAVWESNPVAVLFNPNGGVGYKKPQRAVQYSTVALEANVFEYYGYNFLGWSLTPNGGVDYADGADFTFGEENVILYAVWEGTGRAILFNPNGGYGYKAPQKNVPTGSTVALDANVFTNPGYAFAGWSTVPGGEVAYADGGAFLVGNTNTILYAVWVSETASEMKLAPSYASGWGWTYTEQSDELKLSDAIAALKAAAGVVEADEITTFSYDFDGDGDLSVADALAILRIAVGL